MRYIDAEKIRTEIAEIERRMKEGYSSGDEEVDSVAQGVCAGILAFLDTLSGEPAPKGYDEAYLNEKIAKASKTWEGVDVDKYMDEVRGREPDKSLEEEARTYCRSSFKFDYDEPNDSFNSHAFEFYDVVELARHFAEWQKQQMLKDAVEADVNTYEDLVAGKSWAEFVADMPINSLGDKVRIIIVKED